MLGLRREASDEPVKLGLLRAQPADAGVDLEVLLVAVGGPLRNRPAENRRAAETRQQVQADAAHLLTQVGRQRSCTHGKRGTLTRLFHDAVLMDGAGAPSPTTDSRPASSACGLRLSTSVLWLRAEIRGVRRALSGPVALAVAGTLGGSGWGVGKLGSPPPRPLDDRTEGLAGVVTERGEGVLTVAQHLGEPSLLELSEPLLQDA